MWIDGLHAGFLASGNAARYFQILDQVACRAQFITTRAKVSGRYDSRKKQWTAEVQINIPEPDLVLSRNELPAVDHVLIPAGPAIQVVDEAKYIDALGPLTDGTTLSYAATLHAIHEVRPRSSFETVEVRIDGQAVGILSKAMAEKVLPLVELIVRRGAVPVARAKVTGNAIGAEVMLNMIKASEAEAVWIESIQQRPLVGRDASEHHEDDWVG